MRYRLSSLWKFRGLFDLTTFGNYQVTALGYLPYQSEVQRWSVISYKATALFVPFTLLLGNIIPPSV